MQTQNINKIPTADTRKRSQYVHLLKLSHRVSSGLQVLTQVIVADITTLKWRGLVSGLTSAPFIINAFVGSNVATQILERSGWRWGCQLSIHIPRLTFPR